LLLTPTESEEFKVLLNKVKINTYKKVATILEFIINNSAVFKSDEIP